MRRIAFLWVGLAVACIALGAAAAFETRATRLQAIKTVGIVSAIGEEMSLTQAGLIALGNAGQSLSISAWGLDELIVQQATKLLGGRFRVQAVSYRRAAFAAIRDSAVAPVNLLRSDPFKELVRSDVERIPTGATVKLRMHDGERLKAVLFAADESGIRVKPVTRRPEPSRRITYDRIESIERYQDRVSVGKYAGVGAAIGAGVMLVLLGLAAGS